MIAVPIQSNLNQYVLNVLSKSNSIGHLKQLQAFLIALGHGQTQFFAFKLVRFCTLTLANLKYARLIFDHLRSPNIFLYTAMITAYASQPDHRLAFILYRDMIYRKHPKPNHFIYPHVLKSCPELLGSRGTELMHSHIVKSGFSEYPVVQTALLDSYSRFCSDIQTARQLFDEMSETNVVSWTAMISGYTRLGDFNSAISLFRDMPERDTPSWNAIIAGCTQNGLFSEAISLFRSMACMDRYQHQRSQPNQVTVVCTLSACGQSGMLQFGRSIHGYIYRNCLGPDSFISNALVDMYGKCGSLKEARRIFLNTSCRSLTSWNSMINCFALHGNFESAICVFEEMVKCLSDVKPDEVTFLGVLNACTHGGLVEKGQFKEAMNVVKGMGIEPDEVVWGSLLNGCKIHGYVDLAEFAVGKLVDIDPKNGSYGTMLANIYGELGKWDESRKVRKVLKDRNAYRTPGCSWIEVDNRVHQFYSVDKTHPRTEEIYNILEGLAWLY